MKEQQNNGYDSEKQLGRPGVFYPFLPGSAKWYQVDFDLKVTSLALKMYFLHPDDYTRKATQHGIF